MVIILPSYKWHAPENFYAKEFLYEGLGRAWYVVLPTSPTRPLAVSARYHRNRLTDLNENLDTVSWTLTEGRHRRLGSLERIYGRVNA